MTSRISGRLVCLLLCPIMLFAALMAGCASISTGAHLDESANFAAFRTFSWIDEEPLIMGSGEAVVSVDPLTRQKIKDTIRDGFEAKGYEFVDNQEEADFVIAYTIGTRQEISIDSYPAPYYGYWGWHVRGSHYYMYETTAHSYTKGTLGVDVFDRNDNNGRPKGSDPRDTIGCHGYARGIPGQVIDGQIAASDRSVICRKSYTDSPSAIRHCGFAGSRISSGLPCGCQRARRA